MRVLVPSVIAIAMFLDPTESSCQENAELKFKVKLLAVDTNEACDVGDINKDGQPDVIAGRN